MLATCETNISCVQNVCRLLTQEDIGINDMHRVQGELTNSCSLHCSSMQDCDSYASKLRNCGNPAEYIYRLHKWKASVPVRPQKMRMGRIFQQSMQTYVLFLLGLLPGINCLTFYDWSAAHSSTNHSNCFWKKMPSFIMGLIGCRADNVK